MKSARLTTVILLLLLPLAFLVAVPEIDLWVSGLFYNSAHGFYWADYRLIAGIHKTAVAAGWALGVLTGLAALAAFVRHAPVARLDDKAWLFLFLSLVIGPALLANVMLKDNWGRARPREITEFGGKAHFSPPLLPAHECIRNCSFVSGDGSFGFYLTSLAYVVPRRRSRRVFWGTMAVGGLVAFARLAAGAHFLSDNLFAAALVTAVSAALHAAMYGPAETRSLWRFWFFFDDVEKVKEY